MSSRNLVSRTFPQFYQSMLTAMCKALLLIHVFRPGNVITRFNKIAIQGTHQMAVDKEARAYRESTHTILRVTCPYSKCNEP